MSKNKTNRSVKGRSNGVNNNILFIDCRNSGISGDLFLCGLYDLVDDSELLLNKLVQLIKQNFKGHGIEELKISKNKKGFLYPNYLKVKYRVKKGKDHHFPIKEMREFTGIFRELDISAKAEKYALYCIDAIAEAESHIHNTSMDKVHLHEIGSIDTIIDIYGVSLFLDKLEVFKRGDTDSGEVNIRSEKKIELYCTPIPVGGGTIKISHGIVNIPAPATEYILLKSKIPFYGGPVDSELCTPTGAALVSGLKKLCNMDFIQYLPVMIADKVSIATGSHNFRDFPNILRIYYGRKYNIGRYDVNSDVFDKSIIQVYDQLQSNHSQSSEKIVNSSSSDLLREEKVAVLETTVDDVSAEILGTLINDLLNLGALDVNFIHAQGKKNRPSIIIKVISPPKKISSIISLLIRRTGTLGVRYRIEQRKCLERIIISEKINLFGINVVYRVKVSGIFNVDLISSNQPNIKENSELESDNADIRAILKKKIRNLWNENKILNFKVESDDIIKIAEKINKPVQITRSLLETDFIEKYLFNEHGGLL
ncbi:MAG: LarC family nickel insertion protein [Promethearchaeota archaeon]